MSLYLIINIVHVVAVIAFLAIHFVSAWMAFRLKREREPAKVQKLLNLSQKTNPVSMLMLILVIAAGVFLGFKAHWWSSGWIWTSIVLLLAIIASMAFLASGVYADARRVLGLPYTNAGKSFPAQPALGVAALELVLSRGKPELLTLIGYGGFAIIAWLMIMKPF